ncbi:MAG: AMP-binding protein [Alphaproteobacteria bacterium]|nr:AMP-binding protein [Alphaproteobacteria bacterium]MBV9816075.1 AMP-binding protein [Alphaproteobacteria bacterium]
MNAMTLPQLLRHNAEQMAALPAMREKNHGIWETFTWAQYWQEVRDFALGLAAHGFRRGDKLAVIGDNRPRLYWAQLAAQCLGGTAVPTYQDSIAGELVFVLDHAEVSVVVAEDQEQVDKIRSLQTELPHLELVVYDDPKGLQHYLSAGLKSFADVQAAGREFGDAHPGYVEAEIDGGDPDDLALLTYTSGTTGRPKGVMLSHANLLSSAQGFVAAEDIRATDDLLCYLPMAWIGDSLFSLVLTLLVGFTCNCPERPQTVQRDLRELGPTIAIAPPRIWENMLTQLRLRAADSTPLKHRLFEFFRAHAERAEQLKGEGKPVSPLSRLGLALGEVLVYGPVRDQLGMRRARWVYTGGAPLGPDTFRFFRAFGINIKQVWGSTELAGLASLQPDGEADPDTVGRLIPGAEARIDANGEVLIRSAAIFKGYYKQPDATVATMTDDGWFRTGDSGFVDRRGHLVVVDRAKDVGKLADGTPFAPQFVENKLKFSPYIAEAVAFGDRRPFVAAIVAIDLTTIGNWAERRNLAYTSFQDLSAKPEVRRLIGEEIAEVNASLPNAARIRRFLLLNKEFDADDNEITRTRKIRRRFVAEKYAAIVEAFYRGDREVEVTTEITYEDGRKAILSSIIAIEDVFETAEPAREPAYA